MTADSIIIRKLYPPPGRHVRIAHQRITAAMRRGDYDTAQLLLMDAPLVYNAVVSLLVFWRMTR